MVYENNLNDISQTSEKIAVIGSGIAGSTAAYELARVGYDVTLYEQLDSAFGGTSQNASHVHLGGLYSGSEQTALECLDSAIALKKALPSGLTDNKVQFLVAEDSEISPEDFTSFYERLTNYYTDLPIGDQVFGHPDSFFRPLRPEEYAFSKNIAGGIVGQEVTFDMPYVRQAMINGLLALGGKIEPRTRITEVDRVGSQFELVTEKGGVLQVRKTSQVVNAAGYAARLLDHQLGDRTQYNLVLKSWNIVENSGAEMPPFVIVRGAFMNHYPSAADNRIATMNASGSSSRIDEHYLDGDSPVIPEHWHEIMASGNIPSARQRQAEIMDYAASRFLVDVSKLESLRLIPGISVVYSDSQVDRSQKAANVIIPGWQTIVPTKASHGLRLASEVVFNALTHSEGTGYRPKPELIVPQAS